jgi:hypothetical protein
MIEKVQICTYVLQVANEATRKRGLPMRSEDIDPEHWLYRCYRAVKRVQLLPCTLLEINKWAASIKKEIAVTLTEDGDGDFCRVLRTVFLLGPCYAFCALYLMSAVCVLPIIFHQMFFETKAEYWAEFGQYLWDGKWTFGPLVAACFAIPYLLIQYGPRVLPKSVAGYFANLMEPAEAADEASEGGTAMSGASREFPAVAAMVVSKRHRFCMRLRTTRTIAA